MFICNFYLIPNIELCQVILTNIKHYLMNANGACRKTNIDEFQTRQNSSVIPTIGYLSVRINLIPITAIT